MSSINSVSSTSALAPAPGKFEQDSEKYGPLGATIIGVGSAVGDAASTIVSLSSAGLHELAGAAESGYEIAKTAAQNVSSGAQTLAGEIGDAAHAVGQVASKAATEVEGAVSSIADAVGSAASSAAGYVALGVSAGKQIISEVA